MRSFTFCFLAAVIPICLGVTSTCRAQGATPLRTFTLSAATAATPPRIDGTLDDPLWQRAAHVRLAWDFTYRRSSEESSDVYLEADARFLYVAFVCNQNETLAATQHADNVPLTTDDAVTVYLWPGGRNGFEYGFSANPIGAHDAFSSENSAFAPNWLAVGRPSAHGYVISERIPLDVMRGDGRDTWLLQFDRVVQATSVTYEWAHNSAQGTTDNPNYAGELRAMAGAARTTRTKPRLQLYSLGEIADKSAGGRTSRAGADFAVPITRTASFFGTLHPDYSNVELDQQTISPTVFPRQYQEVRPFFTQGGNFYNNLSCHDCVDYPQLYTPAIPTPREGYAVEGVQGQFTFAGLDAIATNRTDTAQSFEWRSPNRRYAALAQRQSAELPGVHDVATYFQGSVSNLHNFNAYVTEGGESGSIVTAPGAGAYREYGMSLFTPKSAVRLAYHDVGSQYDPVDSYVALNDVRGPTVSGYREFDFGPKSFVQNVSVAQDFQRLRSHAGGLDFAVDASSLTFNTQHQLSLSLTSGENYVRQNGEPGGYANQNGVALSYKGNTSTPTSISYDVGRFGQGYLRSWSRLVTLQIGRRGSLGIEADDTLDALDGGGTLTQWLERANIAYQFGPDASLAIGARRIVGMAPTFFEAPQYVDATNLSLAYYRRFGNSELYAVYGDPNRLATQHAFIIKFIQYLGAQKGT
jgi:hypothetical protein